MSSETPASRPRTLVPGGIDDPVLAARAELKAALAAIEEKANVPRRVSRAAGRKAAAARAFTRRRPAAAALAVAGAALAVGTVVWGMVRLYTR